MCLYSPQSAAAGFAAAVSAALQTTEEQRFSWYDEARPVGFYGRPQAASQLLPQYEVVLTHCPAAFTTPHVSGGGVLGLAKETVLLRQRLWWLSRVRGVPGNVSSLRLWLVLRRDVRAPLLELYLPTGLFVCMSWGSFLVRPAMVPGRMVLLVTTLLSLVTLFESSRSTAPPSQGVKSLDVWQLSCIVFVFLALVEYATILYCLRGPFRQRRHAWASTIRVVPSSATTHRTSATPKSGSANGRARKLSWRVRSAARRLHWCLRLRSTSPAPGVAGAGAGSSAGGGGDSGGWCLQDRVALVAFPVCFLVFNVAYWSAHLSIHQKEHIACKPAA
ncbi:gamma-aminobutyric acid receptor subunit delta-like [Schistocerca cancellata]|uniref:gamma-aminobutyric acid receptor subunit delta-like n=1 Tax=Schistocerca cancellata TaxID=274614 RepID=UPI0021175575|nr:gamma-aminobutyric acid receptor subunit delta-like [Schistocerca cancellata]